jgi:hypothetical protein
VIEAPPLRERILLSLPSLLERRRKTPSKKCCCCSWGRECQEIRAAVLTLPEGSEYDLWKAENAKFTPSTNAVSQKFEEVIRRHLGVAGHPKEYSIAAHHWKLPLLCYRIDPVNRSRKWVKAITAKQAKDFGIGTDKSEQHPTGNNMFCQSPNNPKFELKQYVSAWSSGRGSRQERRAAAVTASTAAAAVTVAPSMTKNLPVENTKSRMPLLTWRANRGQLGLLSLPQMTMRHLQPWGRGTATRSFAAFYSE